MNNLKEKQNSNDLLSLLKLQRYKYNMVSKLATTNFIFSVVLPIILSLIGIIKLPDNYIAYINYIGAICVFICLWLSSNIKLKKEYVAQIQYIFDVNLFDFKQNLLISNNTLTELLVLSRKEYIQKISGLENWYSIESALNKNDAIFSCQQQNIRWDKKLRKKFLIYIICISLISILLITSIAILKNLQINILWSYIFLLMPIISYCATFVTTTIYDLKEQNALNNTINSFKSKKNILVKELVALEEKIYHYRKGLVKIPNWFFKIYRNSMQKEADNFSKIEEDIYIKNQKKF